MWVQYELKDSSCSVPATLDFSPVPACFCCSVFYSDSPFFPPFLTSDLVQGSCTILFQEFSLILRESCFISKQLVYSSRLAYIQVCFGLLTELCCLSCSVVKLLTSNFISLSIFKKSELLSKSKQPLVSFLCSFLTSLWPLDLEHRK